jgi:D-lyxose ketol-isomerase
VANFYQKYGNQIDGYKAYKHATMNYSADKPAAFQVPGFTLFENFETGAHMKVQPGESVKFTPGLYICVSLVQSSEQA